MLALNVPPTTTTFDRQQHGRRPQYSGGTTQRRHEISSGRKANSHHASLDNYKRTVDGWCLCFLFDLTSNTTYKV